MNWIKEQVEARRRAAEERQAEEKRRAEEQVQLEKQMRVAAPKAFTKLADTIVADVEELNKHSEKKFNVRYGEGSQLLEVHHRGELAPLLALSLDVQAEKSSYKHVRVGQRGVETGSIKISLRPDGSSALWIKGTETDYKEAFSDVAFPDFLMADGPLLLLALIPSSHKRVPHAFA